MPTTHAIVVSLCLALASCGNSPAVDPATADGGVDAQAPRPDLVGAPDRSAPDAAAPLSWGTCDTSTWPAGYPKPAAGVECTTIAVPLDHGDPTGPTLSLRVGRHKSKAFPTGKAVFNLAGGPGGSAVWQAGTIPKYMPRLLETFDMIYVDQRGTGGSGYMDCSKGYPSTKAEIEACAAEHAGEDLDHLLTVDAAHDLELARRRLGYGKIYLRGGSYGTRLGLEYIRQHESSVAAAVLDGLAPPDWDYFSGAITIVDQSIQRLVDDCNADTACKEVSPDLGADLVTRRLALKKAPREITVNGSTTYEDEETYVSLLSACIDVAQLRYKVPRAIHQAVNGSNAGWNQLIGMLVGGTVKDATVDPPPSSTSPIRRLRLRGVRPLATVEYVAPGLFHTIVCAEWLPNSPGAAALAALTGKQTWGDFGHMTELAEACAAWKVRPVQSSLRLPVQSSVKALLLSGEIDVRTPPEMGTHTAKTLPNATHVVIPYASHSTISVSCAVQLLTDFFIADGQMSAVDTACLKAIPHPAW